MHGSETIKGCGRILVGPSFNHLQPKSGRPRDSCWQLQNAMVLSHCPWSAGRLVGPDFNQKADTLRMPVPCCKDPGCHSNIIGSNCINICTSSNSRMGSTCPSPAPCIHPSSPARFGLRGVATLQAQPWFVAMTCIAASCSSSPNRSAEVPTTKVESSCLNLVTPTCQSLLHCFCCLSGGLILIKHGQLLTRC